MIRFLWLATRGYRLRPWRSPFLRWRMETYWGVPAESFNFTRFLRFILAHCADLFRFLRWAGRMKRQVSRPASADTTCQD